MFDRLKGAMRAALTAAFSEPDPLWDAYVKASQSELNGAKQAEAACRRERDELRERLAEAMATSALHVAAAEQALKDRDAALARAEKAERFKAFVHKRLDDAGVPPDPYPEHTAKHGCRISGRLNFLLAPSVKS